MTKCIHCGSVINKRHEPKHPVTPSTFHKKIEVKETKLLRDILLLDTTMDHSFAKNEEGDDLTYRSVRLTREKIEKELKEDPESYKIFDFGVRFKAFCKPSHVEKINEIMMEIRDDIRSEEHLFGKNLGIHDVFYGKRNEMIYDCLIFLKSDEAFLLFTGKPEFEETIKDFFFKKPD